MVWPDWALKPHRWRRSFPVISAEGGNVHDVSQRVIEGYFHMILTVEMTGGGGFEALKTRLECLGNPEDFAVSVMHERVFRFMHRV